MAKANVTLAEIVRVFGAMGATGFGSSMLPYYRTRLVRDLQWIDEEEFMRALKIGQALPGLNATNMSVIIGDKLAGPRGALLATLALIAPGAISLCLMGSLYLAHRQSPGVDMALDGVAAAAAAILFATTWKVGKRSLMSRQVWLVAATTVSMSYFKLSLPLVLAFMVPLAVWTCRPRSRP
jgi:chromate transporter